MDTPQAIPLRAETLSRLREFALREQHMQETKNLLVELAAAQCGLDPRECRIDLNAGVAIVMPKPEPKEQP